MATAGSVGPPLRWDMLAGVGGVGAGMFFALEGQATLGRNESRGGRLLDVRDYCKLHIISHYFAVLCGAGSPGGPRVLPVGLVGDDDAGRRLLEEMKLAGMDISMMRAMPDRPTLLSVCFQYPDGSGGNITTTNSAASELSAADVDAARQELAWAGPRGVVLAAPEAPLAARLRLLEIATECGAFRAAAIASAEADQARDMGLLAKVDLLAMNEDEAAAVVGQPADPEGPGHLLDKLADNLRTLQPTMQIVVSAGSAGAYALGQGDWQFCPSLRVQVASTAGAGDALLGGTLSGLCMNLPLTDGADAPLGGREIRSALDLGVLLAAMTVTSPHTIHPGVGGDSLLAFAAQNHVAVPACLAALMRGSR